MVPVGEQALDVDTEGDAVRLDDPGARMLLEARTAPRRAPPCSGSCAEDTSIAPGGWLAVSAPTVQRWTDARGLQQPGEAVGLSWQYAFLFPCQRKPAQALGINEPATLGVVWGDRPLAYRFDGIWQTGARRPVRPEPARLRGHRADHPAASRPRRPASGQVYRLDAPGAARAVAYRVDPRREVVSGWSPAPNTTMSVPLDEQEAAADEPGRRARCGPPPADAAGG